MDLFKLPDTHALRETISRTFLRALLSTPSGRAYVLTQAGVAESTDEGAMFDHIATRVDDPALRKMVKKHAEDETLHAALFFACADRQGVARPEIPDHLRVLQLLDARIGIFGRPVGTDQDVMRAYLVLQVIEERAVEQFSMIEPVMRRFDRESADVLAKIAEDERRHLLYCRAITKRYAPSEALRIQTLEELREAEAHAFRDHQHSGLMYVLTTGLLPPAARWFWKGAAQVLARRDVLPYTRFHGTTTGDFALAA